MGSISVPSPVYKGEEITVTGYGFTPGEEVTLSVYKDPDLSKPLPDPPADTVTATADANGDVSWEVDPLDGADLMGFSTNPDGWESVTVRHVVTRAS